MSDPVIMHAFPYALVSYFTGTVYDRYVLKNSTKQIDVISDSLPFATSNYIPSIIALRDIFLKKFKRIKNYGPAPNWNDRITITKPFDLAYLPTLFNCSEEKLLKYNRQFKKGFVHYILPPDYSISIPVGTKFYKHLVGENVMFSAYNEASNYVDFYASLHIVYSFLIFSHDISMVCLR